MQDRMTVIPFQQLMNWLFAEYETQKTIFGVSKLYFYTQHQQAATNRRLFGQLLEAPLGPAAGPHTQLAQNIIAAYAGGARYFELKTVQALDGEDLPVDKPCIWAEDEGYNVEWSTELKIEEALGEYIKAWFALKLISKELELGATDGFIFNMSVGYDLKGIQSPKIDGFMEGLKDASHTHAWQECKAYALEQLPRFSKIDKAYIESISPQVTNSVTLSTLHGCPAGQILGIGTYLLQQKKLNTFIKCNPTLLGYDFARTALDGLGYEYLQFDQHHFKEDLQFDEAVSMIKELQAVAKAKNLAFGIKLTNTFPVDICNEELPGKEMYLSGRPLFPLTITLAEQLSQALGGGVPISFSGGVDAHQLAELVETGIYPITLATTLLKPGGYNRLYQLAQLLEEAKAPQNEVLDLAKISCLAKKAVAEPYYRKSLKPKPHLKLKTKAPLFHCFTAPCKQSCPIQQDIPAYLSLVAQGNFYQALQVITKRNPLPFITGTICNHSCMFACSRSFYEGPIEIRETKRKAAEQGFNQLLAGLEKPVVSRKQNVAIIGGGPAGLAAAYFLAKAGAKVSIFEKSLQLGGIVSQVIPNFRISAQAIAKDLALIQAMGIVAYLGREITSVGALQAEGYSHIILANGAWQPGILPLEVGAAENILDFLRKCKEDPQSLVFQEKNAEVVIIGGGNAAIDGARAAKRLEGVKKVTIAYRRTKAYMPADEEELALALEEGIELQELLAPVSYQKGVLLCKKLKLGSKGSDGRRLPLETGKLVELPATHLIAAVGEGIDKQFYAANQIQLTAKGLVAYNPATLETDQKAVYVVGDARRGPASVVEAIADGLRAAQSILSLGGGQLGPVPSNPSNPYNPCKEDVLAKRGKLYEPQAAVSQYQRCLECETACLICAEVCPNRANVAIQILGKPHSEVIHLEALCNHCGNCASFCPYASAPYEDKFTLFWEEADFDAQVQDGFVLLDAEKQLYKVRFEGAIHHYLLHQKDSSLPQEACQLITTVSRAYPHLLG